MTNLSPPMKLALVHAGSAGSYVSGSPIVVDGAQWLYKKPGVPMDVVLKASRGVCVCQPPWLTLLICCVGCCWQAKMFALHKHCSYRIEACAGKHTLATEHDCRSVWVESKAVLDLICLSCAQVGLDSIVHQQGRSLNRLCTELCI